MGWSSNFFAAPPTSWGRCASPRSAHARLPAACVYIFAIDGRKPVKIGRALTLKHQLGLVQDAHAEPVTIEHVSWCPSAATAAMIVEDIRHKLGAPVGGAGWYNIEPAATIEAVRKACA
jgi:hypothetical protein